MPAPLGGLREGIVLRRIEIALREFELVERAHIQFVDERLEWRRRELVVRGLRELNVGVVHEPLAPQRKRWYERAIL